MKHETKLLNYWRDLNESCVVEVTLEQARRLMLAGWGVYAASVAINNEEREAARYELDIELGRI